MIVTFTKALGMPVNARGQDVELEDGSGSDLLSEAEQQGSSVRSL